MLFFKAMIVFGFSFSFSFIWQYFYFILFYIVCGFFL